MSRFSNIQLGFHVGMHYQWQSIDEKQVLILWKLNFIWMKIMNGIFFQLNWNSIQMSLNWIQIALNLIQIHWMEFDFKFNWKQMLCKLVEKVLNFFLMNMVLDKKTFKTTKIQKYTFHAFLCGNELNKFKVGIVQVMIITYGM